MAECILMVVQSLEMRGMKQIGNIIMSTGRSSFIQLCTKNLPCIRFVDRDMLLHYHWGQGVGHAYSHTNQTTIDPLSDPVPTPMNSQNPVSDMSDFEHIDPGGEVEVSDAPDNQEDWEDWYEDSNGLEPDDPTTARTKRSLSLIQKKRWVLCMTWSQFTLKLMYWNMMIIGTDIDHKLHTF